MTHAEIVNLIIALAASVGTFLGVRYTVIQQRRTQKMIQDLEDAKRQQEQAQAKEDLIRGLRSDLSDCRERLLNVERDVETWRRRSQVVDQQNAYLRQLLAIHAPKVNPPDPTQ